MPITLNGTNVHFEANYKNEEQLNTLINWCEDNISKDIYYSGDVSEQYNQYYALVQSYIEHFLPHVSNNLTSPVSVFNGLNTLEYAVQCGYHIFLENLTVSPQILNSINKNGMSLLHKSAVLGYFHTAEILLAKGANPYLLNRQNQNPIFQALFLPIEYSEHFLAAKKNIFYTLVKCGADLLDTQDDMGDSPLHLMVQHDELIELTHFTMHQAPSLAFIKNKASCYPIHTAVLNNQYTQGEFLLSFADVPDLEDAHQRNALHYAAQYGSKEMVQLCIKMSSIIEKRDSEWNTPLLLAADYGNQKAMQVLLTHGADINTMDYKGFSVLHYAVNNQNIPLTQWLLTVVPPELINLADNEGHPPLYYAKAHHNEELESLLLKAGS